MKNYWKWLTIIFIIFPPILIISTALLFFVNFVNLKYYQNLIGAKDYKSIYDWDYPATVTGDFNNDGKEDQITSDGCVYFGARVAFRDITTCEPLIYSKNKPKIVQILPRGFPIHSYMIKEGEEWFILIFDKNFHLTRYAIQNNETIEKMSPTIIDYARELLYVIPAFFFFAILSMAFRFPAPERMFIPGLGVYCLFLIFSGYMWYQTDKRIKH